MASDFTVQALPAEILSPLSSLTDEELSLLGAKWVEVDSEPGFPCRVSLTDARVGERVLAFSFEHHDVDSPYRSSGPIFVREHASMAEPARNEIPEMLRHRLLSIRAYDSGHTMIDAQVNQGAELEHAIENQFKNGAVEYIHIHNANQGCFDCAVYRA
jgi:hypothetical protein